jgi:hypothetical protein
MQDYLHADSNAVLQTALITDPVPDQLPFASAIMEAGNMGKPACVSHDLLCDVKL